MATSVNPSQFQSASTKRFDCEQRQFHYLDVPHGFVSGMAYGNLGYQMQYSVRVLERQLAEEGCPHVLQLNAFGDGECGWENPCRWHLYADGFEVANGSGEFARACFEESAKAFLDTCREAVEAAGIPDLGEREFYLLCRTRDIARCEPFDDGNGVMGSREGRV